MSCEYPELTRASAYRNGCRCTECRNDKRATRTLEVPRKRRTGKTGRQIEAEFAARMWEERKQQVLTIACSMCAFTITGPLADVGKAHLAHRLEQHPDVKPRTKRHHPSSRIGGIVTKTTLDENLDRTRAQGGAAWM